MSASSRSIFVLLFQLHLALIRSLGASLLSVIRRTSYVVRRTSCLFHLIACHQCSSSGVSSYQPLLRSSILRPTLITSLCFIWIQMFHSLLLPVMTTGQLADLYCYWFFFSRIRESTTGYTFTPCVGSFTSPGIDTR